MRNGLLIVAVVLLILAAVFYFGDFATNLAIPLLILGVLAGFGGLLVRG